MHVLSLPFLHFPLPANRARLIITPAANLTWLAALVAGVWAILAFYLPIMGGSLTLVETIAVTLAVLVLAFLSLAAHLLAHSLAAPRSGVSFPAEVVLFPFGDAAHTWPSAAFGAASAADEALAAISGPFTNLLLAGLAYLAWNLPVSRDLGLCLTFASGFNAWLAVINLIPAYPFDGGRLLVAVAGGLLGSPASQAGIANKTGANNEEDRIGVVAIRWAYRLGLLFTTILIGWTIFLLAQGSRYSPTTGLITFLFAVLLLTGLLTRSGWHTIFPTSPSNPPVARAPQVPRPATPRLLPLRLILLGALILFQAGSGAGLLLTNNGLEAPGVALSVEPMVSVPAQYRHNPAGTFILTSVLDQTPILAGEWLAARLIPGDQILPPEKPAPHQTSPQESARLGFQQLDQSVVTAEAVGVSLAGYPATVVGKGAIIVSFTSDSLAQGILQAGDIITAANGAAVHTPDDLITILKALKSTTPVRLSIQHAGQTQDVSVPLIPPTTAGGAPRLGIAIDSAGVDYQLPFPVSIVPQKIVGGPSAGLMFTLTVYNLLSAQDLTGGHKIAGTGTINPDGTVGPIGGVQQKVAAAEAAGAQVFLSPVENYADARAVARHIQVVQVATVQQAIDFLRSLSPQSK